MAWGTYLNTLDEQRAGVNLPADRVPAAFLVADVAGEIVGRALLICDDDNAGSRAVIEACGGQLESVVQVTAAAPPVRRYWIG